MAHQIEVIQRRTRYRLRKAEERAHILRGLVKALDALDEVIALIRRSPDVDEARDGPDAAARHRRDPGRRDPRHAAAPAGRAGAAEDHRRARRARATIADLEDILASEARQRQIVGDELAEIVDKFGDERRTQIIAADGDLSMEDLIPDEDLVVTITRGGYAKRTRADLYRTQKRGGKGVRGATLRGDDVVEHFFATTNHHWLLFFTTAGRVYRTKAYNLPEAPRDAKGGHVAGLLAFQPDEQIAQVLAIRDYEQAPYLVLATRNGLVKKTRLGDYNSPRQAGVIAINFREDDDELIGAELVGADDDILLVSRKGQSIRFRADDAQLRPMGRATSGVTGHEVPRRRPTAVDVGDPCRAGGSRGGGRGRVAGGRAVETVKPQYVFTITDGGFAKRSRITEYRLQSRGGIGIKAMKLATRTAATWSAPSSWSTATRCSAIKQRPGHPQPDRRGLPADRPVTKGVKFVTPKAGDGGRGGGPQRGAKADDEVDEAVDDGESRGGERSVDPECHNRRGRADEVRPITAPRCDSRMTDDAPESPEDRRWSTDSDPRAPSDAAASTPRRRDQALRSAAQRGRRQAVTPDVPAPTRPDRASPAAGRQSRAPDAQRRARLHGRPAAPARAQARLRLVQLDPWSVMKTAFLLSIAFGIVTIVAGGDRVERARRRRRLGLDQLDGAGRSMGDDSGSFDVGLHRHRTRARLHDAGRRRRRGAADRDRDARCVPLQPRRGAARRHRGHPGGGRH